MAPHDLVVTILNLTLIGVVIAAFHIDCWGPSLLGWSSSTCSTSQPLAVPNATTACPQAVSFLFDASHTAHRSYVAFYKNVVYDLADDRLAEANLAVISFAVWSFFYKALQFIGLKKMGQKKSSRRQIISERFWSFFFWTSMNIVVYLGVIDISQRFLQEELEGANVIAKPPQDPPSLLRLLTEVCFSVWAYDFIFFFIHRSFHASSGKAGSWANWWYSVHLPHHDHYADTSRPLHVLVTYHHHILDATAQVGINIIVQQIPLLFLWSGPRHTLSKLLHNVVVTYLLVEAHSGYDLPFMSHRLFPSILGGSVRHQEHHHVGRRYFHQFFKYLDDHWGPLEAPSKKVL